jgi:hypothetical protein
MGISQDEDNVPLHTSGWPNPTQPEHPELQPKRKENAVPGHKDTRFALVGTTNEWCLVTLQLTLLTVLEKHLESMKKEGLLHGEYGNQDLPPFLIRKTKFKLPKLDAVSKQDAEFIKQLWNCNINEVADANWPWMKHLTENFALAGKLKRVVSRQASILELTHSPQSGFANTRFLKGLKMQMLYNHFYRTSNFAAVTSMDYPIRVGVHPGCSTPFKKMNLHQELMCMRHPPDSDGNPCPTFIDGVHYVHMGPKRGHIRVLY